MINESVSPRFGVWEVKINGTTTLNGLPFITVGEKARGAKGKE